MMVFAVGPRGIAIFCRVRWRDVEVDQDAVMAAEDTARRDVHGAARHGAPRRDETRRFSDVRWIASPI
jgi:hypothetical protein